MAATARTAESGANAKPYRMLRETSEPVSAAPAALPTVNAVMIQANASTAVPAGVSRSALRNTAVSSGGSESPLTASSAAIGTGSGTSSNGRYPAANAAAVSGSRPGPPGLARV
jgi:hypothetical protein